MESYSGYELRKRYYTKGGRDRYLGTWKGTPVYIESFDKYDPIYDNTVFYVLFDKDNIIVKGGLIYGHLQSNGDVKDFVKPISFYNNKPEEKKKSADLATKKPLPQRPKKEENDNASFAVDDLLNEVLSRVDSELNVAAIASHDFGVKDSF